MIAVGTASVPPPAVQGGEPKLHALLPPPRSRGGWGCSLSGQAHTAPFVLSLTTPLAPSLSPLPFVPGSSPGQAPSLSSLPFVLSLSKDERKSAVGRHPAANALRQAQGERSCEVRGERSCEVRGERSCEARGERSCEARGERSCEARDERRIGAPALRCRHAPLPRSGGGVRADQWNIRLIASRVTTRTRKVSGRPTRRKSLPL